jgi:cytochrome c-type biogenesis protein CcmH
MTIFWILAGGLALLAIAFVVAPLLKRSLPAADVDQDQINLDLFKQQLAELDNDLAAGKLEQHQYDAARRDLERELLYDVSDKAATPKTPRAGGRWAAPVLAIAVPAIAVGLYQVIGYQEIITKTQPAAATTVSDAHAGGADGMPPLDVLVERLAKRMEQNPDDVEGWIMLGRTYFTLGQPESALAAIERAYALAPENTEVMLHLAEATAAAQDSSLEGRPAELVARVLKQEPENASARWLSGMIAFQRGQYNAAVVNWQKVLAQLDPAGDQAGDVRRLIEQARQRSGAPPQPADETRRVAASDGSGEATAADTASSTPPDAGPTTQRSAPDGPAGPAAAASSGVEVSVSIDPAVAGQVAPDDTLFVYAKAAAGPPMPLAVHRGTVADLPLTVRLDDSMAMMPQMRLSAFPEVIVGARVSESGQAMPQSGDVEGETGPVATAKADSVSVTIDRVRP